MAFERFTTRTDVISQLSDRPNDSDRLDAAGLKAKFDEAVTGFVSWVNNTLIAALEARTASGNIGFESEDETFAGDDAPTTVKGAFEKLAAVIHDMSISGVADGGVTTVKLHDEAVTEAKLAGSSDATQPRAVSTNKIQLGAIATELIADLAVTAAKIRNGEVNSDKIAPLAVTGEKIANLAVSSGKIADGAVTSAKLATGAALANIASGTITNAKLAGGITNDKIANSTIAKTKLAFSAQTQHRVIDYVTISPSSWTASSGKKTGKITANGVTTSNTVLTGAWVDLTSTASTANWQRVQAANVRCIGQTTNGLYFECDSTPTEDIWIRVIILD